MTYLESLAKDCIENHTHKLVDKPTKQDIYLREESIYISGYKECEKQLIKAKELLREMIDTPVLNQIGGEVYENEEYTELVEEVEQFLKELVSYEIVTDSERFGDNVNLTIHGSENTFVLKGPAISFPKDKLREIEFRDLRLSKNYIKQIHEEGKHTQAEQDECNYIKRINTTAILNYLKKAEKVNYDTPGEPRFNKSVANWISHQIAVKQKELKRLDALAATDEDIIQNALMEYGNQERYNGDVEIANKITDVRNRYLNMINPKGEV